MPPPPLLAAAVGTVTLWLRRRYSPPAGKSDLSLFQPVKMEA
jgi:hypothetical protein